MKRSAVMQLPDEARSELNRRLEASSFTGYDELAAWLQEQGFEISRSAVHRYGQQYERQLDRLRTATRVVSDAADVFDDDEGKMGGTAVMMAQAQLIELMLMMQDVDETTDIAERSAIVGRASKAAGDLMRAEVARNKWRVEVQRRAAAVADQVDTVTRQAGLSDEAAEAIRSKILGIGQ